jgi:hypothetical protein
MKQGDTHFSGFSLRFRPAVPAILLVLCMVWSAGCAEALLHQERVVAPRIVPVENAPAPASPVYHFPFESSTITLTVPVNGSVLAGAKAADKEVTIYGNISEPDWVAQTYLSMMNDPNQEEFYRDLITRLREIKEQNALNDDEYVELMTVFVQSIQYENVRENPVKFPIETFMDKSGDCDDKSLLLAGLLSREGYRVALFSFSEESHMAVGIACPGTDYKNTGYAYVETTNFSFVGVPPDELISGISLNSEPAVIPVRTGTKTYTSCDQTRYLDGMYVTSEQKFFALSREADAMRAELQALSDARNINAYNQRVPVYNHLIDQMRQYAGIYNYILTHRYDRKGTYEWVKSHSVNL